jgi:gas vesicle protein
MGEDPSAIREQVEQTRERMGDTVEALAYKADVKTRAKDNINEKTDRVKEFFGGAADSVNEATPSTGDVKQGAKQAVGMAKENPLGLAIGAVALGFLGGLLIPSTAIENEKIGPMADQVKDQVKDTAQTVVDHGKEAAQDAAQAATQAVKETGQEHAEQAKSELQDQAQEAKEQVGSTS